MGAVVPAREYLFDQFPRKHQILLPPVLKAAYAAAKALVATDPILRVPSATDNHGRVVSWAVDLFVERLIQSGRWPVDYRWREYGPIDSETRKVRKGTGHYLEVVLSHAKMTISQVADPKRQPRDVKFRENGRLVNAPLLKGLDIDVQEITGIPTFVFVHGHLDLSFAHAGVPHPVCARQYAFQTDNLLLLPHEVPADTTKVEDTEFNDDILFLKEELDKRRKDHDG